MSMSGMTIQLGVATAIEGYREPGDDTLRFRDLPGERTTTLHFPEGIGHRDALLALTDAMNNHMRRDTKPVWVDGSDKGFVKAVCQHYGITLKSNKRPADWGNPTDLSVENPS